MAGNARKIRFLFDYISSNAYLAWVELPKLAARHGSSVEPVPVLFAGLLEAHGQLGPAEVRPEGALDGAQQPAEGGAARRAAASAGSTIPSTRCSRFARAALPLPDAERDALVTALFAAVWARGLHVSEPEVVAAVAAEAGLAGRAIVARAGEPEAKARLRFETDAAIAAGVFGVPTMQLGSEVFWGYDDLPYLELALAGKDPLDEAAVASWVRPGTASAMRRRFRAGDGA